MSCFVYCINIFFPIGLHHPPSFWTSRNTHLSTPNQHSFKGHLLISNTSITHLHILLTIQWLKTPGYGKAKCVSNTWQGQMCVEYMALPFSIQKLFKAFHPSSKVAWSMSLHNTILIFVSITSLPTSKVKVKEHFFFSRVKNADIKLIS